MYYDLHIHSALSPCADDLMTVNNIVNMAIIKELELIAITDHNSVKQLKHLAQICKDKIDYIYGVELQSKEEIHILAYFHKECDLDMIQDWIDDHLIKIENNPKFFGNQLIFDNYDNIKEIEERLLLSSLDLSINELCKQVHFLKGFVILAHVLGKKYGIYQNLGFIPPNLEYDGIEVNSIDQIDTIIKITPNAKDKLFVINSDAHQLTDINEAINKIDINVIYKYWR